MTGNRRARRADRAALGTHKICSVCEKQIYIAPYQDGSYMYKAKNSKNIMTYQCCYTHWKQVTGGVTKSW